jgi:hypothetical protein
MDLAVFTWGEDRATRSGDTSDQDPADVWYVLSVVSIFAVCLRMLSMLLYAALIARRRDKTEIEQMSCGSAG